MTGPKKIAVIVLIAVFGLMGAFNWWRYLQEGKGVRPAIPKPAASRTASSVPDAEAEVSAPVPKSERGAAPPREKAGGTDFDPDPPKRVPLSGGLLVDPFKRESAMMTNEGKTVFGNLSKGAVSIMPAQEPVYRLELVLVDGERRWALVNGRLYSVGERVGPFQIIGIGPREVKLRGGAGEVKVLRLMREDPS